ncbi:hypothetical protein Y032_0087g2097 [Ancylostoma ceylanicum]|uniref:Uncharacterized protein n=1 Tax=Ancylostoma ceylanicum TaxID=53326 RepID=A0A016TPB1_9BILA|nr:hypothetical protein Y032_0087g2097 [Ancylostoma ceylanicum]
MFILRRDATVVANCSNAMGPEWKHAQTAVVMWARRLIKRTHKRLTLTPNRAMCVILRVGKFANICMEQPRGATASLFVASRVL